MRLIALDSVRGIAALAVVLFHSLLVFPDLQLALDPLDLPHAVGGELLLPMLAATPLRLLWAGGEAVLLFFVLSGFVLALSLAPEGHRRPGYLAYAAKRVVRLLLPCAVVALALAVLVPVIDPRPRPELGAWFNSSWTEPVTTRLVLGHALLLFDSYVLNNPMWSLAYELRISLLLPLLVLLGAAGPLVLAAATIAGIVLCLAEMKLFGTGVLTTLLFVPHFAMGVMLARYRRAIASGLPRLGAGARAGLWLLCFLLLNFGQLLPAGALVGGLATGAGGALLIALVLGSRHVQAALEARPWPWLGAISYSLYLVHVPVLLAAVHLAPREVPVWALVAAAPLASILVAAVFYRLVERPSIGLSRRVGLWVEARTAPAPGPAPDGGGAWRLPFGRAMAWLSDRPS